MINTKQKNGGKTMKQYRFYTAREISPQGWLREQLKIQAQGLAGNLDKMWPDVRDSAWIGGPREGWERVPYWLDGFLPLAYLLGEEDLKERAQRYIDAILASQKPDGWLCPCADDQRGEYDIWALFLMSKVLTVYYDCTGDERVPDVLYRAMKNCFDLMKAGTVRLVKWGKFRWYEAFLALELLYDRFGEAWIRELAGMLRDQGQDYRELYDRWVTPLNKWTFETHIVNLMMTLKCEAITHRLLGEAYTNEAEKMYRFLKKYNGTPTGLFTGDECLAGLSPTHGTELCAVMEFLYSCEQLYARTGDPAWMERLERAAFNALPATVSEDMWTHQYVQMSNQINCERFPGKSYFRTVGKEAHMFGLEPHFGCCTANMGQGWPKLALSAFMQEEGGIVSCLAVPACLRTEQKGIGIRITTETNYPFENSFAYIVETDAPVSFRFSVRIPSFAKSLKVDGREIRRRGMLVFDREWKGRTEIRISFETEAKLFRTSYGLYSAEMGSLVFALPIASEATKVEYERDGVKRVFPYCDYQIRGTSEWRYGFADRTLKPEYHKLGKSPFSAENPPVTLKANLIRIDWKPADGYEHVAGDNPPAVSSKGAKAESLTLLPYGCARLRVTEMPIVRSFK